MSETDALRTPAEWDVMEDDGLVIYDPDGWRYDGKPWDEPLTREEFRKRRVFCTLTPRDAAPADAPAPRSPLEGLPEGFRADAAAALAGERAGSDTEGLRDIAASIDSWALAVTNLGTASMVADLRMFAARIRAAAEARPAPDTARAALRRARAEYERLRQERNQKDIERADWKRWCIDAERAGSDTARAVVEAAVAWWRSPEGDDDADCDLGNAVRAYLAEGGEE